MTVAHLLVIGLQMHSLGEIVMILLVEKWVMSLDGLNMNVVLVGICLALKESGLGATPPWGRGGVEGCCTTAPVCAGEVGNRDGEEE